MQVSARSSIDKTAPTVAPSVTPNPVHLNQAVTVNAGATDSGSGIAIQSCGLASTDSVGTKTVTCTATDYAGNTSSGVAEYQVIFSFSGFLIPVKNPPSLNTVLPGQPVLFRFSLGGDQGLDVLADNNPQSTQISCRTLQPIGNARETLSRRDLDYTRRTGIYNYVWNTRVIWFGTCRQFSIEFIDGQVYTANFKFLP